MMRLLLDKPLVPTQQRIFYYLLIMINATQGELKMRVFNSIFFASVVFCNYHLLGLK